MNTGYTLSTCLLGFIAFVTFAAQTAAASGMVLPV
jgi:hypothetical protein